MMDCNPVRLSSEAFQEAVASYIHENKPNRVIQQQLENWKLKWENFENDEKEMIVPRTIGDKEEDNLREMSTADSILSDLSNQKRMKMMIRGDLTIRGEYVEVSLHMECIWCHFHDKNRNGESNSATDGILSYSCRVISAKLIEASLPDDDMNQTEHKIRKKVLQRLRQDSYIGKILSIEQSNITVKSPSLVDPYLAKARIHVEKAKNVLEERVDVSETIAEALRRAIWSSADSSLDMIEVLLSMPSLPIVTGTNNNKNSQHLDLFTSRLANRAKLRLLEDAMLDECEKEGEGELIQELTIDSKVGGDNCVDKNNVKGTSANFHTESKQHKSKKSKLK